MCQDGMLWKDRSADVVVVVVVVAVAGFCSAKGLGGRLADVEAFKDIDDDRLSGKDGGRPGRTHIH